MEQYLVAVCLDIPSFLDMAVGLNPFICNSFTSLNIVCLESAFSCVMVEQEASLMEITELPIGDSAMFSLVLTINR